MDEEAREVPRGPGQGDGAGERRLRPMSRDRPAHVDFLVDLRRRVLYLNSGQNTQRGVAFTLRQPTVASPVKDLLSSDDPLSPDAIRRLIEHREEDDLVEYKAHWNLDDTRRTLEITKDVIAFANTHGGFLVFGVENESFRLVGLAAESVRALVDINKISQKLNSHIKPGFPTPLSGLGHSSAKGSRLSFSSYRNPSGVRTSS